ncbi:MAG: hypothetical protein ACJ77A_02175 [Actinomycetota bacterium]
MGTSWHRVTGMVVVLLLVLTACGGGEKDKGESEGGGTAACDGSAIATAQLKIPKDFPTPDGVTFTDSNTEGPSRIAGGYFAGDLKDAHDQWKSAFETAGWTVLADELDEHDSEVNYQPADQSSTGQVKLGDDCKESGRTAVDVTDRPA